MEILESNDYDCIIIVMTIIVIKNDYKNMDNNDIFNERNYDKIG